MKTRKKKDGCIKDGCSFSKPINTRFENTVLENVPNPREGSTPAPTDIYFGSLGAGTTITRRSI